MHGRSKPYASNGTAAWLKACRLHGAGIAGAPLVAAAFRLRSTSRFPGTAFGFDVPIAIPLKKDASAASCPRPSSSIRPAPRPQILPPAYRSSAPPRPAHRLRLHAPIFLGRGCSQQPGDFPECMPRQATGLPLQPRTLHCRRVPMPAGTGAARNPRRHVFSGAAFSSDFTHVHRHVLFLHKREHAVSCPSSKEPPESSPFFTLFFTMRPHGAARPNFCSPFGMIFRDIIRV